MATIGNYGVYEALLQTPVEGPEFADELGSQKGNVYFLKRKPMRRSPK